MTRSTASAMSTACMSSPTSTLATSVASVTRTVGAQTAKKEVEWVKRTSAPCRRARSALLPACTKRRRSRASASTRSSRVVTRTFAMHRSWIALAICARRCGELPGSSRALASMSTVLERQPQAAPRTTNLNSDSNTRAPARGACLDDSIYFK
ncbi:PP184 [Orf virus]|uniref:PP184 n=1 Tax=Orf virus TaxID=10258 RepID=F1AX24_ORFV|nr:PP184 [Orf virus]